MPHGTMALGRDEALARARRLIPTLRQRAAEGEALRRVPDATIDDLIASGLLRLCQPARFGGAELGWDVLCETSIELGQGDGAQAWVANVYGEHPMFVALFPDAAQHEVWDDDPDALICASIIPQGNRATAADGGYRLSGRWSFTSGVHHAHWIILGELVGGDPAESRLFLVPRSQFRIDDDWHTIGMVGTGSASVILDEVLVPAHRTLTQADINEGTAPGARINTAPMYRMPLMGFAQLALAAVPVGVAIGMVEDFTRFIGARTGSGKPPAGAELLMERLSEAAAETRAAALLLLDSARTNAALLAAGKTLGEADAARSMRDGGYAVTMARRAATRLFEVTGGRGLNLSTPLQRAFRDVIGAAAHGSLGWPRSAMTYAQFVLRAKGDRGFPFL
ncbi:MAG: acyl-CoA dehydrogenase family protein [Stellaceae bacterium]